MFYKITAILSTVPNAQTVQSSSAVKEKENTFRNTAQHGVSAVPNADFWRPPTRHTSPLPARWLCPNSPSPRPRPPRRPSARPAAISGPPRLTPQRRAAELLGERAGREGRAAARRGGGGREGGPARHGSARLCPAQPRDTQRAPPP